ncbi:DUF1642 domain-containing protein [Enterococcus faecalis]
MNKQELVEELECLEIPADSYSYFRGAKYVVERAISLAKQLDEPKKVVVPKFVAEYIEIRKRDYEVGGLGVAIIKVLRSCNEPDLASWMNNNTEVFARAWLDGYEVEKESRYYVKVQESYIVYIVSNKEIHMKKCKQELATTFTDKKAAEAVAVLFDGEVEEA